MDEPFSSLAVNPAVAIACEAKPLRLAARWQGESGPSGRSSELEPGVELIEMEKIQQP
jgi:hypothetical protein